MACVFISYSDLHVVIVAGHTRSEGTAEEKEKQDSDLLTRDVQCE